MEFYLQDSAATEALGRLLGKHAASGDVFCLSGDWAQAKHCSAVVLLWPWEQLRRMSTVLPLLS